MIKIRFLETCKLREKSNKNKWLEYVFEKKFILIKPLFLNTFDMANRQIKRLELVYKDIIEFTFKWSWVLRSKFHWCLSQRLGLWPSIIEAASRWYIITRGERATESARTAWTLGYKSPRNFKEPTQRHHGLPWSYRKWKVCSVLDSTEFGKECW